MYKIIFLTLTIFIFSGCSKDSIQEQKLECKKSGKKFHIEKVLNLRTGKYEVKGECI